MNEPDWKKIAQHSMEVVADMLKELGVPANPAQHLPVSETREAVARIRRDASNEALEEAAKVAESGTCGDQDTHESCGEPSQCEARYELAASIRALKVAP